MMAYIQLSLLGCPGYFKVGNTLTEPMTGPKLLGEDTENMWYTPFYFKDTWHYRRAFAAIDAMMVPEREEPAEERQEQLRMEV